jgi:hypothetical protein
VRQVTLVDVILLLKKYLPEFEMIVSRFSQGPRFSSELLADKLFMRLIEKAKNLARYSKSIAKMELEDKLLEYISSLQTDGEKRVAIEESDDQDPKIMPAKMKDPVSPPTNLGP